MKAVYVPPALLVEFLTTAMIPMRMLVGNQRTGMFASVDITLSLTLSFFQSLSVLERLWPTC
jgi:hypothetical protein